MNTTYFSRTMALGAVTLLAGTAWAGNEKVTYAEDVAPIFNTHCVSCHRAGEIAPFALTDFANARAWAKSIGKAVHAREMPPWHANSEKIEYLNDRSLPKEAIETILAWVKQGAPSGDLSNAPEPPEFSDKWSMGEPDHVFQTETEFLVPANEDEIEYQTLHFENDLDETVYIQEWEIRPRYRKAVHHANLVHAPKRMERVTIEGAVLMGGDYIGSYLPGARPMKYPEGTALRLPKGAIVQIQVHYVGLDEDVKDRPMFGMKFANGRVDKLIRVCGTGDDHGIVIEPYEEDWSMTREIKLLHDVTILSSGAHMHLRGSAYTARAIFPDGATKLITEVPNYDFNWQSNYQLANPIDVPKGTVYSVEAHWDNSEKNPNNPDPSQTVKYGLWTNDEMLNTWSHIVLTNEKLGLKVEDGRVVGKHPDAQESEHPFILQGPAGG